MDVFDTYVLIEPDRPHVEVRSRQSEGSLLTFADGIDGVAKLPALGVTLPLKAIYAGVPFPPTAADDVRGP